MKDQGRVDVDRLYSNAFPARRNGPLYGAFPYPTKISPEAISIFIAAHTEPGQVVFDGFAGSGTTGLAALTCDRPSAEIQEHARRLGVSVNWGPRNAYSVRVGRSRRARSQDFDEPARPCGVPQGDFRHTQFSSRDGWLDVLSFLLWCRQRHDKTCCLVRRTPVPFLQRSE